MVNNLKGKPDFDGIVMSDVGSVKLEEDLRKVARDALCEPTPAPRKRATKDRK